LPIADSRMVPADTRTDGTSSGFKSYNFFQITTKGEATETCK